jgi:hypothetical protein
MIHWPMTPEQTAKVGLPIVPRSKVDPTRSAKQVSAMFRDIEERYLGIKRALKSLFYQRLTGREREANSHKWHFLCHVNGDEPTLYKVNAGKFIYDMSPQQLSSLLDEVQRILDEYLLEGGDQRFWAMDYVTAEAQRGTLEAFNNLSQQSQVYASQTTLQQLLSSPAYQNQIAAAQLTTFSDWKAISDAARADLTGVITDAIARGVNPGETAAVISKRLDVSMAKAKSIAQTEQVGALRQAQWNETDWAADRLGLNTGLLWLSALKPTTRTGTQAVTDSFTPPKRCGTSTPRTATGTTAIAARFRYCSTTMAAFSMKVWQRSWRKREKTGENNQ